MGWLKGRQVYTATAVFNLAGDTKKRSSYRRTVVAGAILSGAESIGSALTKAYMNGPGTKVSRFHKWALENYTSIGVPGAIKLRLSQVLPSHIKPLIQDILLGKEVAVRGIVMAQADFAFWAEKWLLENMPDLLGTLYSSEIDPVTDVITIRYGEDSSVSFAPTNFVRGAMYIYAGYTYQTSSTTYRDGMFIYKVGSGNSTLDALYKEESSVSQGFLAPIPVRLNGTFLSDEHKPAMYSLAKKAFKKATGAKLTDVVDQLSESESLDDMDYVYIAFGVSVSSKQNAGLKCVYNLLHEKALEEVGSEDEYQGWKNTVTVQAELFEEWRREYKEAPPDGSPPGGETGGVSFPPSGGPSRPWRGIKIENPGGGTNYDVRYTWTSLSVVSGTGLKKPDAKVGDYWFHSGAVDTLIENNLTDFGFDPTQIEEVFLYHQESLTTWKGIRILGMVQKTYVFGNNFEELSLGSQLIPPEDDPDRESSFLFPIRYSDYKALSIKEATELAANCSYVQIHAYSIYIQRIYETPVFTIILVVIIIAITVASGGLGGASVGILGANAAVGAALGLAGVAAVIAGAALNAIAAMVVSSLIMKASTEIFGEKIGRIIGVVASLAAMNGLSNMAANGSFAIGFGQLSTAQQILMATSSVSDAVQGYFSAEIKDIAEKTKSLNEKYEAGIKEISKRYEELLGYGNDIVDPMWFLSANRSFYEAPKDFLSRTLMTGSDIADLSLRMVSNFADIALDLENVS